MDTGLECVVECLPRVTTLLAIIFNTYRIKDSRKVDKTR